jgi:hypothetical protein
MFESIDSLGMAYVLLSLQYGFVTHEITSLPLRIRSHTQFVILINFMNFLMNFNLTTCTFQYIHT